MIAAAAAQAIGEPDAYEMTVHPDRESWLRDRVHTIGASDAAAALSLSPYDSRYSLWSKKVPLSGPGPENRAMRRGHVMEPFVASEYALEHKRTLVDLGKWTTCRSTRWPWMSCTPDRLIQPIDERGWGLFEIKAVNDRHAWASGSIPEHYKVQVMASLAVLGLRWGVLAGYVMGTDEIIPVEIERDDDHIEIIVEETRELWDMVLDAREAVKDGKQPMRFPDPDASQATADALRARWRTEAAQDIPPTVDTDEARAIESEWTEAAEDLARAEDRVLAVKTRVMGLMEDRPQIRLPGGTKVTWKTVNKKGHTVGPSSNRELRRYAAKGSK